MARGAFRVTTDANDPRRIDFSLRYNDVGAVPEIQLSLMDDIAKALAAIQTIFPRTGNLFRKYHRELYVLAKAGLEGETAQPALARRALKVFQDQLIAHEAMRVKNEYLRKLGARAIILGFPPAVAAFLLGIMLPDSQSLANFLLLWTGCMAGVWLSVGARKIVFDLGDLHIPRHDQLEPWVRLTLAGLFSLSLGILFSTRTLVIAVGSVETWQFREQPEIAVLLGVLCGFVEQLLSARAASRARDVLQLEIL